MSATATLLLNAIPTSLAALYPTIPVIVRKGEPGPDPHSIDAGWKPGDPSTCFVVSCEGPEEVDGQGGGSFEQILVRYFIQVSYMKPAAASPGRWAEDPDVRTKRQEIRDYLYKPTYNLVPGVWDVRVKNGDVYEVVGSNPVMIASPVWFSFLSYETRGSWT